MHRDTVQSTFQGKINKFNLESCGAQDTLNHILTAIKVTEEQCMKTKSTKSMKSKNYWDNNKIQKLTDQKRRAFINCKKDKNDQADAHYKQLCKKVKKLYLNPEKSSDKV